MKKLKISAIPLPHENSKSHFFKYHEPQNKGCLIALFDNSLTSAEGFKLGKDNSATALATNFSPYPLEAGIVFDGSVMSLQGSRKIAFISRGAKELNIDIARIKENDLNWKIAS